MSSQDQSNAVHIYVDKGGFINNNPICKTRPDITETPDNVVLAGHPDKIMCKTCLDLFKSTLSPEERRLFDEEA